MEKSSPGTPTSSSPDQLHPCQVDDSELSDRELVWNRLAVLPALALVVVLIPVGIVAVAVLERWRAWRGSEVR